MKKLIAANKGRLVASSVLILFPTFAMWILEGWFYVYSLFLLVLHWACLLLIFRDRANENQNKKALGMCFWIVPILSLLSGSIYYMAQTKTGGVTAIVLCMYFGFGLLFVGVGNYLPKLRRNSTVGIRVKWALENNENWRATHRFGGKVWVACGFLCMISGLFINSSVSAFLSIAAILTAAFLPMLYSYCFYRKQVREGKVSKGKINPWGIAAGVVAALGFAGFMAWALLSGDMQILYGAENFTVDASGWGDLTIEYRDIEKIEYQPQDASASVSGSRTNGFGNLRVSMGAFENEIYGDYTRYTYNDCPSCVVLTVKGETVVINGETDGDTRAIYEALAEKAGGN